MVLKARLIDFQDAFAAHEFDFVFHCLSHVFVLPRYDRDFIFDTDALNFAMGGQLSQLQNGFVCPIACSSKKLTPAQRKYCTTRRSYCP